MTTQTAKYWAKRQQEAQKAIAKKTQRDIEKQLRKYYGSSMERIINEFEATYNKLIATVAAEQLPTPADLYKLDKYWKLQSQLQRELQKLGDKSMAAMQKQFIKQYLNVYNSIELPVAAAATFTTVDAAVAMQAINAIWVADGIQWSQRIWNNMNYLQQTLNDNLVHCVVTGKKPRELRNLLKERFEVSNYQANRLIRTETAHIQTEAAKKRYEDYGLKRYKFLADTDERTCKHHAKSCEQLDGKIFYYSELKAGVNAPPMHPNCRCTIVPIIE